MSLTDDVAAARAGDREAFGRLVGSRLPRLVRLARSIVGAGPADDVVQDACVAGWRHLRQLEDAAKFDNWLMRIVYRSALRAARWDRLRASVFYTRIDGKSPDAQVARDDQAGDLAVWQVLSKLPTRQRAVLHLTVIEGMTDSEIARALGIRASSVRAHRRRARARVAALWNGSAAGERG